MNKEEERKYFELFRKYYPLFPDGIRIHADKPDFLIKSRDRIIGIEVTRFHEIKSSKKFSNEAKDSNERYILDKIQKYFNDSNFLGFMIDIKFNLDNRLIKEDRDIIAKIIFNFLKPKLKTIRTQQKICGYTYKELDIPFDIVAEISLYYTPVLQSSHISSSEYGHIREEIISEIQSIILIKDKKLLKYNDLCNENWLVIYTTLYNGGSFVLPSDKVLQHKYNTLFDKIFFLKSFEKEVYTLKVIKK